MQWKHEEITNVDSFQRSLLPATTINIKLMVINYPELHRAMFLYCVEFFLSWNPMFTSAKAHSFMIKTIL